LASISVNSTSGTSQGAPSGSQLQAQISLFSLFFMWGFITCLNDILIPYLRGVFTLTIFQATLVQFAFFGAYFLGALFYFLFSVRFGDPINRIGYKNGIIIGLAVAGAGCFLFYPAAIFLQYGLFLGALFCLGLGLTMLQIAANPYVALLGRPESASSRLNLAQGFNSFGTTIAPVIGGFFIFQYFVTDASAGEVAVKIPYIVLACLFWLLAVVIFFIKLPKFANEDVIEKGAKVLGFSHLRGGIFAIFAYVGAEVAIGSLLINFMGLENITGLEEGAASKLLSFYWGGAMIGRFMGAIMMSDKSTAGKKLAGMFALGVAGYAIVSLIAGVDFMDSLPYLIGLALNYVIFMIFGAHPNKVLAAFSLSAIVLLLIAVFMNGAISMWVLLFIGLFNSIMWSNIFTLAIKDLGRYTSQGSSLLVMAVLGGAVVPPIQGLLADEFGIQMSFLLPVVCYVYLFYYGWKGYEVKQKAT
jgi:MFS transporter, FHS family, L-fucose permease